MAVAEKRLPCGCLYTVEFIPCAEGGFDYKIDERRCGKHACGPEAIRLLERILMAEIDLAPLTRECEELVRKAKEQIP